MEMICVSGCLFVLRKTTNIKNADLLYQNVAPHRKNGVSHCYIYVLKSATFWYSKQQKRLFRFIFRHVAQVVKNGHPLIKSLKSGLIYRSHYHSAA